MRRILITLTVVAMVAAVLPLAALVAAAAPGDGPAPVLSPQAGVTAVKANMTVTVAGATDLAEITGARLVAFDGNGDVAFRQYMKAVELNRAPGDYDYLRVADGQFEGQIKLACGFARPTGCPDFGYPTGEISGVAIKVNGAQRSNIVRVDYTKPEILRYELVGPQTVRVVFSEPVRAPDGDNVVDWNVEGVNPQSVSDPRDPGCTYPEGDQMTTGCSRLLELPALIRQTEDATPRTMYLPNILSGQSAVYEDFTNNTLRISDAEDSNALDRIRPAAPHIQTIDGENPTGTEFVDNNPAPVVRVTNLLGGHTARLRVTRDGGGTRAVSEVVADGANAVDMTLPFLSADGGYAITALAIDASGNRSTDDTKAGPAERSNGARPTADYLLDRRPPEVLAATLTDTATVVVEFTEELLPAGDAGRWFVGDIPVTASGNGNTRTLKAGISLANPGLLRWEPTASDAGSTGRYGDRAGNGMVGLNGLELNDLPALSAPRVTAPTRVIFTDGDSVTLRGTADNRPNLVAELYQRGSETRIGESIPVSDGRWSTSHALAEDGRYQFEVRIRDTQTGVFSQRSRIADVVRDTAAPEVEVHEPAATPLPGMLAGEYGVGDAITISWTATDAADDAQLPDHVNSARVIMVSESDTRKAVSGRLEARPGQEQSFTYRLTRNDLEDQGFMDLSFEVRVDDLARNVEPVTSGTIRLLADRVGYTPVLTEQAAGATSSVIEARFPTVMTGQTLLTDWTVEGAAITAQPQLSDDGRSVLLTVPLITDPNIRPRVQFVPTLAEDQRLRTADNGTQVAEGARRTIDRLQPALTVQVPDVPRVLDARQLMFRGETEASAYRNTVLAYRTRASGERIGPAIAKKPVAADGSYRLAVPLVPNRVNRIVIQAVDPSGNRSTVLPSSPFTVTEDSLAPVVRITSPRRATRVRRVLPIRWNTVEANPGHARLFYRVRGEDWRAIASRTDDDGYYRWTLPKRLHGDVFDMRVQAFDRTAKRRTAAVSGLVGDFARPVVRRAIAVGARSVRLFFSERVYMPRHGFTVDGIGIRRVVHDGARNTLILNRPLSRTTPVVRYDGTTTRDLAGNRLAAFKRTAERGFVFAPSHVNAQRISATRVRVEWRDTRNRPANIKYYRIYRDGTRIGTVSASRRAFADTNGRGAHTYSVRAFDDERRYSAAIGDRVR